MRSGGGHNAGTIVGPDMVRRHDITAMAVAVRGELALIHKLSMNQRSSSGR